eukprot:13554-Hanusia_phi.AAC.1
MRIGMLTGEPEGDDRTVYITVSAGNRTSPALSLIPRDTCPSGSGSRGRMAVGWDHDRTVGHRGTAAAASMCRVPAESGCLPYPPGRAPPGPSAAGSAADDPMIRLSGLQGPRRTQPYSGSRTASLPGAAGHCSNNLPSALKEWHVDGAGPGGALSDDPAAPVSGARPRRAPPRRSDSVGSPDRTRQAGGPAW